MSAAGSLSCEGVDWNVSDEFYGFIGQVVRVPVDHGRDQFRALTPEGEELGMLTTRQAAGEALQEWRSSPIGQSTMASWKGTAR